MSVHTGVSRGWGECTYRSEGGSLPDCASFLIPRTSKSSFKELHYLSNQLAIVFLNKNGQRSKNQGDQDHNAGKHFMF